ncbi:MAG TPA: hypothetical protein VHZ26_03285 [Caulobacteraceae bacterium]|jgi:hypothetical protein|nr:hypothetical protein [Caulobacteraceae bacterium]
MRARGLIIAALAAPAMALQACAMTALPPPQATLDNIQTLRADGVAPISVGAFIPGPGAPTQMDRSVAVRAGIQPAPEGSFARYLGDTIAAQLKSVGKLDPNSTLVVSGMITDTHLDSGLTTNTARAALAARFTLVRGGKVVFEKALAVDTTWDSEFVGAVAIPDAVNHYTDLFAKLAAKLFADPDFVAAARG